MAAETQLRPFDVEEAPDYGANGHLFSVELEHNGFFCGKGDRLTYIQPTTACIDYCNTETWSLLWIEDILQQLGYERDGRLHVYWSPPGKEIFEGLVCIERDADILEMIKAVENHKTLVLLVDHTNFLKNLREESIINVCPPMESSARKLPSTSAGEGTSGVDKGSSSKSVEEDFDKFYDEFYQEEDESNDSDFLDSDFEVEDGDDDLFRDNVDTEVNDNNEPVQVQDLEDDDALEDADLNLRKEQRDKLQYKFGTFNPQVDMDNPVFKVGMAFSNAEYWLFGDAEQQRSGTADLNVAIHDLNEPEHNGEGEEMHVTQNAPDEDDV